MKIIVTGASGNIGRALVPYLIERGHKLLLVGRNASNLEERFPHQRSCSYSELGQASVGFDTCVHLAVLNNDTDGDIQNFRAVNVGLLKLILDDLKIAGCGHFINLTSFHSADPNRSDFYTVSKREADKWLGNQTGIRITSLHLPAVYSPSATGNLANVNKLPRWVQPAALTFLGALKPIVDMEHVIQAISEALNENASGEKTIVNSADSNPVFVIFKKMIDWSFALSILVLAWWLLVMVFATIKITSQGPAIFVQERIGQHRKKFNCYKFRTMRLGTRQVGTHDLGSDAVTNIGRFLRRTKIDELPQIINILRGELSLVGPRPCLPIQTQLVEERARRGVTGVLPGITGWAQINNIDMSDPVRLAQADYDYIGRRTIPFELSIIVRTFFGAGRGDRVTKVSEPHGDSSG